MPFPSSPCILVCEDDPAMIRIFQFLLRQQGITRVVTTDNGDRVAALVQSQKPDLILLDLMLPAKDGITILRELKQQEASRLVPVIVVSGRESQDQVHQAMMAGAIDYVIKPFEPGELGLRIKTFLEHLHRAGASGPAAPGGAAPV